MHWAVISSALSLATASAALVFQYGWAAEIAFAAVGIAAAIAALSLLVVGMLMTEENARPQLWNDIFFTFKKDFSELIRFFQK